MCSGTTMRLRIKIPFDTWKCTVLSLLRTGISRVRNRNFAAHLLLIQLSRLSCSPTSYDRRTRTRRPRTISPVKFQKVEFKRVKKQVDEEKKTHLKRTQKPIKSINLLRNPSIRYLMIIRCTRTELKNFVCPASTLFKTNYNSMYSDSYTCSVREKSKYRWNVRDDISQRQR